ncbi:YtxH domain-containing protein [Deinococcus arenicola]|uniref:YtxH domain-containing protein n=1 Tax=Deinococcus arenicola TaxID=2994950 RepID=A0ABU4DTX6_9DEIO|nr:YtxH domain-containing protein [Deinococcus sp. ZS9-10]MDV6375880.1 YtxH domain-containing protein [Deinococcus sp. ZS9-10]
MATIQSVLEDVKDSVQDSAQRLEGRAAVEAGKAFAKQQHKTMALLADQQKELQSIRQELKKVRKQRQGGGFPWTLVLLAGSVYALYRSNPEVRDQIDGLLGRIDPGLKGNLARAGDAVKDAASDVMDGKSPSDAVKRAGGELQRAGEKAVDGAKDAAADLQQDAQAKTQDIKQDAQIKADGLKADAKDAANGSK